MKAPFGPQLKAMTAYSTESINSQTANHEGSTFVLFCFCGSSFFYLLIGVSAQIFIYI